MACAKATQMLTKMSQIDSASSIAWGGASALKLTKPTQHNFRCSFPFSLHHFHCPFSFKSTINVKMRPLPIEQSEREALILTRDFAQSIQWHPTFCNKAAIGVCVGAVVT